ncbi:MAG: phosphatidate cytidylyltransferase [Acidobacteriota bacterium]|nr:phosphatidate cytidylyltransferase [Acidobacteriota bacterium]
MKRVLTAVVLIPLVLLVTFKAPIWLFAAAVTVVAVLAMREYMDLVKAYGFKPFQVSTYAFVLLYFALLGFMGSQIEDAEGAGAYFLLAGSAALIPAFVYGLIALRQDLRTATPSAALSWFGFIYVGFALGTLVLLRTLPLGSFYLLYLFVVVWSGDISAYYVGTSVGKHRLAPVISPKKTWEGTVASVVTASVLGALILHFSPQIVGWAQGQGLITHFDWPAREQLFQLGGNPVKTPEVYSLPLWKAVLWSALINVAAQFGDLVESMIKRGANVKDSGSILPGHGGVLDRVDALLFAAPFGFAVILFAISS